MLACDNWGVVILDYTAARPTFYVPPLHKPCAKSGCSDAYILCVTSQGAVAMKCGYPSEILGGAKTGALHSHADLSSMHPRHKNLFPFSRKTTIFFLPTMTVELIFKTSPTQSPSPPRTQATNTVTITSLPRSFFDPLILDLLRTHFSYYGEINQWVPLPGFGRIIVVYEEDHSAERAKVQCDPILIQATNEQYVFFSRLSRRSFSDLFS